MTTNFDCPLPQRNYKTNPDFNFLSSAVKQNTLHHSATFTKQGRLLTLKTTITSE